MITISKEDYLKAICEAEPEDQTVIPAARCRCSRTKGGSNGKAWAHAAHVPKTHMRLPHPGLVLGWGPSSRQYYLLHS